MRLPVLWRVSYCADGVSYTCGIGWVRTCVAGLLGRVAAGIDC